MKSASRWFHYTVAQFTRIFSSSLLPSPRLELRTRAGYNVNTVAQSISRTQYYTEIVRYSPKKDQFSAPRTVFSNLLIWKENFISYCWLYWKLAIFVGYSYRRTDYRLMMPESIHCLTRDSRGDRDITGSQPTVHVRHSEGCRFVSAMFQMPQ
jgi:hypothetical protein